MPRARTGVADASTASATSAGRGRHAGATTRRSRAVQSPHGARCRSPRVRPPARGRRFSPSTSVSGGAPVVGCTGTTPPSADAAAPVRHRCVRNQHAAQRYARSGRPVAWSGGAGTSRNRAAGPGGRGTLFEVVAGAGITRLAVGSASATGLCRWRGPHGDACAGSAGPGDRPDAGSGMTLAGTGVGQRTRSTRRGSGNKARCGSVPCRHRSHAWPVRWG